MFIKYEKFRSIYFLIQKLLVSLSCNKIKSSMKKSNRNYLLKYRNVTIDRFEIVKFFSYTSTIMCGDDLIFEIDGWRENEYVNLKTAFDSFYRSLIQAATSLYKDATGKDYSLRFGDNKTVFQIRDKYTGNTYFIGRYDWRRAVGKSCYMYDGYIIDFKAFKESGYLHDVIGTDRGVYAKFEI